MLPIMFMSRDIGIENRLRASVTELESFVCTRLNVTVVLRTKKMCNTNVLNEEELLRVQGESAEKLQTPQTHTETLGNTAHVAIISL